jgi:hypothetical protein
LARPGAATELRTGLHGQFDAGEQADGWRHGIRNAAVGERGDQRLQYVPRIGGEATAGVAGELVEEPVRGWLSRVVAGEKGLDRELLVALGGVAWPGVGQGTSDGGHGDGDERSGGVVAGLGGDLEPVAFPSGVALAPPSRAGERGVGGAGLPVAGGRELGDAVGVEREVGDVLAG